jgi:hypothetical protein
MKHITVLLGLACAISMAAGCSAWFPPCGSDPGVTIPAHMERKYAAMSLPAFAADGSLYVMNGTSLLHYAAGGQHLGSITLPVNVDTSQSWNMVWPRAYATRNGEVFVTSGRQHIGLLNAASQFSWVADTSRMLDPLPCGDGLLVAHGPDIQPDIAYMDLTGAVRWTMPVGSLFRDKVQVDEQDRAYFCDGKILAVKRADGGDVLRAGFPEAKDDIVLMDARADRVLLGVNGAVICIDLAGEELWRITLPEGAGRFLSGRVLGRDRFVLHVYNWPKDVLLVVDGQGQVVRKSQEKLAWLLLLASSSGYLARYSEPDSIYDSVETWGWFDADGVELWSYQPPEQIRGWVPSKDSPVVVYPNGSDPALGPDGRIYFERNSTLYVLDPQGHVVWHDPGTVYYDVWVEEMYIS